MAIHLIDARQVVCADLPQCWAFFSNPANLATITPPSLDFKVIGDVPSEIYPGLMIRYRVRPLFHIPATWLTEITHVRPMHFFVDEQRIGPYRLWHHEHTFRALSDDRVEIHDRIHYVVPGGFLGDLLAPLLIQPRLNEIFAFRRDQIVRLFPDSPPA